MTDKNDQSINQIEDQYPLPIALKISQIQRQRELGNYSVCYYQLSYLYEFIIRYLTAIVLSMVYTHIKEIMEYEAGRELDKYIREKISEPRLRICIEILYQAGNLVRYLPTSFMEELFTFVEKDKELHRLERPLNYYTKSKQLSMSEMKEWEYREESEEYLAEVLKVLKLIPFIADYPLVRLIVEVEGEENWKAEKMSQQPELLDERIQLQEPEEDLLSIKDGWDIEPGMLGVYNKAKETFLGLRPFALFEECIQCRFERRNYHNDFFLYQGQHSNDAIFLGAAETPEHEPHRRLISLNFFLRLRWDGEDREVEPGELKQLLDQYLGHQVRLQKKKYDPDLYTQRGKLDQVFEKFLRQKGDPGFLLIGDSGTGKTNFMLEKANELNTKGGLVLFHNCASWDKSAEDLGAGRYISKSLGADTDLGIVEKLDELLGGNQDQVDVYLFLDAINETQHPERIIASIELEILDKLRTRPWMKVVISCRSESWDRISNKISKEKLYFQKGGTIEHRLSKFTASEMKSAYEKYQKSYQLQSKYAPLPDNVLEIISYPLMMRLVAESFSGSHIPENLTFGKLFQKYDREMLGGKDGQFQKERKIVDFLVELFIEERTTSIRWSDLQVGGAEGGEENKIDADKMIRNYPNIYSWILDRYSPNSPYVKLLDMGILMETMGPDGEIEIRFAYDQYLEYKIAEYIFPGKEIDLDKFQEYLRQSTKYPTLYGAMKSLLITREAITKPEGRPLLRQLTELDDPQVQGVLSDFLATWAQNSDSYYQEVVDTLGRYYQRGEAHSKLAVRVANVLKDKELLMMGMMSEYQTVSAQATIYSFLLWQYDPSLAEDVFTSFAKNVKQNVSVKNWPKIMFRFLKGQRMRAVPGLESYLNLLLLMFPLAYHTPKAAKLAGESGTRLLDSIPDMVMNTIDHLLSIYIETSLDKILSGSIYNQYDELKEVSINHIQIGGVVGNKDEKVANENKYIDVIKHEMEANFDQNAALVHYFQKSADDPLRESCAKALNYGHLDEIDLDGPQGDHLFELAQIEDRMAFFTVSLILYPLFETQFEDLYRFSERLYRQGNSHSHYLATRAFTICVSQFQQMGKCRKEYIEFANEIVFDLINDPEKIISYPNAQGEMHLSVIYEKNHLGFSIMYEMYQQNYGDLKIIKNFLKGNWQWRSRTLQTLVILKGFEKALLFSIPISEPKIDVLLETLAPWIFKYDDMNNLERKALIDLLSLYYMIFPNEVERYLLDASKDLRNKVVTVERTISIPLLAGFGYQVGLPWMIQHIEEFRVKFMNQLILGVEGNLTFQDTIIQLGQEIGNSKAISSIFDAYASINE